MLSEVLRRDTLSQAGRARAAKAKPQTDAVWSLVGDSVFAVLVLSSVAWGLASIGHYKGWWNISAFLGEHYPRPRRGEGQVLRAVRAHPVPLVRGHVGGAVPLRLAPGQVRGARRLRLLHPARLHRVFGRGVPHGAAEGQGRLGSYATHNYATCSKLTAAASAPGETPLKLRPGRAPAARRRRGRRAGRHTHGRRHQ